MFVTVTLNDLYARDIEFFEDQNHILKSYKRKCKDLESNCTPQSYPNGVVDLVGVLGFASGLCLRPQAD